MSELPDVDAFASTEAAREAAPPLGAGPSAGDDLVEGWVRDHGPAMYRVAAAILRDPQLAEDAVQDSLLRAWRAWGTTEVTYPRAWLLRITHNVAISAVRKERAIPVGDDRFDLIQDAGGDTEREAVAKLAMVAVQEALATMDPVTASILILREVEDLTYDDICEITGLPLPTVKTRLHRGRQQLQTKIRGWRP